MITNGDHTDQCATTEQCATGHEPPQVLDARGENPASRDAQVRRQAAELHHAIAREVRTAEHATGLDRTQLARRGFKLQLPLADGLKLLTALEWITELDFAGRLEIRAR